MTLRILAPLLLLAVLATVSAYGHQDAIIPLVRGKLQGLPENYQPATFSRAERKLQIGNLSVTIPPCLWQHFSAAKESEFRFLASWYHDVATLPPYISVSVADKKTKTQIQLLINLDTLALISLTRIINDDNSFRHEELPLEKTCQAEWSVRSIK